MKRFGLERIHGKGSNPVENGRLKGRDSLTRHPMKKLWNTSIRINSLQQNKEIDQSAAFCRAVVDDGGDGGGGGSGSLRLITF